MVPSCEIVLFVETCSNNKTRLLNMLVVVSQVISLKFCLIFLILQVQALKAQLQEMRSLAKVQIQEEPTNNNNNNNTNHLNVESQETNTEKVCFTTTLVSIIACASSDSHNSHIIFTLFWCFGFVDVSFSLTFPFPFLQTGNKKKPTVAASRISLRSISQKHKQGNLSAISD